MLHLRRFTYFCSSALEGYFDLLIATTLVPHYSDKFDSYLVLCWRVSAVKYTHIRTHWNPIGLIANDAFHERDSHYAIFQLGNEELITQQTAVEVVTVRYYRLGVRA